MLSVICWGETDISRSHLAVFSIDIALACHFEAPHPIEVLVILIMAVKELKWWKIQLAIHSTVDMQIGCAVFSQQILHFM